MRAVVLEGHAVNPGDISWEPLKKAVDTTIYEYTSEEGKMGSSGRL